MNQKEILMHPCLLQKMKNDICWWIENVETASKPILHGQPEITLFSDASTKGWGGVYGNQSAGGRWNLVECENHINYLELLAAYYTLLSFCKGKEKVHVRLMVDNTTAVACINKMGSKTEKLNDLTRIIWLWCKDRGIYLSAAHVPGSLNIIADKESRTFNEDTEWMLKRNIFHCLTASFGPMSIDLFASRLNHQLPRYISWRPDPQAHSVDAFTFDWSSCYGYIFPPFSLLSSVLQKLEAEQAQAVVICPMWTTQAWFPKLLKLLVDNPVILPKQALIMPQDPQRKHPLQSKLRLMACKLSGIASQTEEYRQQLPTLFCHHGGIQPNDNIGVISTDGCSFVVHKKLIHCSHL